MSMDMFDNILENIDEDYPFSLSPKIILALLITAGHMCNCPRGNIHMVQKKNYSYLFYYGKFN